MESKLDRILVNEKRRGDMPFSKAYFDTPLLSDHSPAIIMIREQPRKFGFPFQFKNFWCDEREYKDKIALVWRHYVRGSRLYALQQKLKTLKGELKHWDKNLFADLKK